MSDFTNTRIRPILLWLTLALTAALFGLSVYGSCCGWNFTVWGYRVFPRDAGAFFNSPALAAFWIALAVFLIAGIVLSPRILRRGPSLAMHVGGVLVLAGSMWNSPTGHDLARKWGQSAKVPSGYMQIGQQEESDWVFNGVDSDPVGRLPFTIHLNRFWIDYYETAAPWGLWAQVPRESEGHDGHGHAAQEVQLAWKVGDELLVPTTQTRVKVLQFIPQARVTSFKRVLEILPGNGPRITLPAEAGQSVELADPKLTLRVLKAYDNAKMTKDEQDKTTMVEVPVSPDKNMPVVQIEIERDGQKRTHWTFQQIGTMPQIEGLSAVLGQVAAGAQADPASRMPAMQVSLTRDNPPARADVWLIVRPGQLLGGISLRNVLGPDPGGHEAALYLARPAPPIQSFNSDVDVKIGDRNVERAKIQVNHPLHYGGYHFYQNAYDAEHGQYTVLSVASDSGLWMVWLGMALVTAGTFWFFWVQPAIAYFRRGEVVEAGKAAP